MDKSYFILKNVLNQFIIHSKYNNILKWLFLKGSPRENRCLKSISVYNEYNSFRLTQKFLNKDLSILVCMLYILHILYILAYSKCLFIKNYIDL